MAIDIKYNNISGPTVDFSFDIKWSKKPSEAQIKSFDELIKQWGWDGIEGKYGGWDSGGHFDYISDVKHGESFRQIKDEKISYFYLDAGSGNLEKGLKILKEKLNLFNEKAQQSDGAIIESIEIEG